MGKTYAGRVTGHGPGRSESVVVQIEGELPKIGSTMELRVVLTDEELGRRFRTMFLKHPKPERSGVLELCDTIENDAGWPVLADLIREVIDG